MPILLDTTKVLGSPSGGYQLNRLSPQARALVGWWPMLVDGVGFSGTTALDFIAGNHAVPYDSTPNMTISPEIFPSSQVMDFPRTDALNDMLTVPNTPYMAVGDHTWTCWVRVQDTGQVRYGIMGRDLIFSNGKGLYFETTGTDRFIGYSGVWQGGPASGAVSFDTWYHLAFVLDNSEQDGWLYLNGVLVGTDLTMGGDIRGTENMKIAGINYNGTGHRVLSGNVFDVRWYNRVLNASQIWNIYNPLSRWELFQETNKTSYFFISDSDYPEILYNQRRLHPLLQM